MQCVQGMKLTYLTYQLEAVKKGLRQDGTLREVHKIWDGGGEGGAGWEFMGGGCAFFLLSSLQ